MEVHDRETHSHQDIDVNNETETPETETDADAEARGLAYCLHHADLGCWAGMLGSALVTLIVSCGLFALLRVLLMRSDPDAALFCATLLMWIFFGLSGVVLVATVVFKFLAQHEELRRLLDDIGRRSAARTVALLSALSAVPPMTQSEPMTQS